MIVTNIITSITRTTKRAQTFYDGTCDLFPGICHLPVAEPFCQLTRSCIEKAAEEANIPIHTKGTCVTIEGPRFSSKAESLLFRSWDCDVINMTTVPEVILAKEAGLCYAAVAMATDYDSWHPHNENVNVELALKTFRENVSKVTNVLCRAIPLIAQQDWSGTIEDLQVSSVIAFLFPLLTLFSLLITESSQRQCNAITRF